MMRVGTDGVYALVIAALVSNIPNAEMAFKKLWGQKTRTIDYSKIAAMYNSGMSFSEIRDKTGINTGNISRIIKSEGIQSRRPTTPFKRVNWTPELDQILIDSVNKYGGVRLEYVRDFPCTYEACRARAKKLGLV